MTKTQRGILIVYLLAILLVVVSLICSGCAINSHKESATTWLRVPEGTPVAINTPEGKIIATLPEMLVPVTYTSEVWQGLFLYFSKAKGIDHRTDYSSFQMGEIESVPDANSIKASGELAGHATKVIMGI